ncbi:AAA family ATPase [Zeaxanthinibacter sp. PT1]|uniref:AAA family ATPase n=1 Tax=Zeaxanthinibacter TaxID=561554 RepID=UPI00234B660E|nr:AAA family ATPase [Zeaxanthinibacter sp. PT1]MDC6350477.1 AAA family ATPase [Zeaxanthinibacter sp. PT1]
MFLVPYNQLSPDQKSIIRRISREKQNLFVEGPPGSGKTLISLYTLRDIIQETSIRPLLLMYNHSLYGYLKTAMEALDITDNITIATKDKFFWDLGKYHGVRYEWDEPYDRKYGQILQQLNRIDLTKQYDITVVDEVQDLRPDEWKLVQKLSHRITSLGDFNQGVYETKLDRGQVVGNGMEAQLSEIFRFHKNIAKLANAFSRKKGNLEGQVTKTSAQQPKILDVQASRKVDTVSEILDSLKQNRQRIGIICPDKQVLQELSNALKQKGVEHNYYIRNKDLRDHDFQSNTPLLITSFSAKGLEFEHVIIYGFSQHNSLVKGLRSEGRLNDVIYVSLTRTNSNLYLINTPDTIPELKNLKVEKEVNPSDFDIDDLF